MRRASKRRAKRAAVHALGYRSQFEIDVKSVLPEGLLYEPDRLQYSVLHNYTPDFKIKDKVYIEVKGRFTAADRAKHLHIKKQHPDVTIYFIFQKADNTLNKASKTTYGSWCDKYGFEWTDLKKGIPPEWLS